MKNTTNNTPKDQIGKQEALPFSKSNFTLMIAGIVLIFSGFFVMTLDKEEFGFGFLGITLGPAIAFTGFIFQFYTIFKKK
jgi:hypothetical protein